MCKEEVKKRKEEHDGMTQFSKVISECYSTGCTIKDIMSCLDVIFTVEYEDAYKDWLDI